MKSILERYLSSDYLNQNPSWDEEDSPWKAEKIVNLLNRCRIEPQSICEVGCGAGGILAGLRDHLNPACQLVGYDIAPALQDFWIKHTHKNISFVLSDFLQSDPPDFFDLLLIMDVLEHLENPFDFLRRILGRANWIIFHIPLDLHAQGAIRNTPFLRAWHQVGHIHSWNKDLALSMLAECGLEVVHWEYTAGAVELPTSLIWRKLLRWPRRLGFLLAPDLVARLLGGYSLLVLAKKA